MTTRVVPLGIGLSDDHPHRAICTDHEWSDIYPTRDDANKALLLHECREHCPCGAAIYEDQDRGGDYGDCCPTCTNGALSSDAINRSLAEKKEAGEWPRFGALPERSAT